MPFPVLRVSSAAIVPFVLRHRYSNFDLITIKQHYTNGHNQVLSIAISHGANLLELIKYQSLRKINFKTCYLQS